MMLMMLMMMMMMMTMMTMMTMDGSKREINMIKITCGLLTQTLFCDIGGDSYRTGCFSICG